MKKSQLAIAITAAMSLSGISTAQAEDATTLKDALSGSSVKYNFRYRYEMVDQDGVSEDAGASTLKSRLTVTSKSYNGFTTQVELDNVSVVGDENHNDTTNGMGDHAVVADPESSEINQAWISYKTGDTEVKAGRQRIVLDNQRFVGGVAWRQNEQTYDAATVINKSLPDTTVTYSYIHNVNNIFGKNVDTDTSLFNVKYTGIKGAALSGYHYAIEHEMDTTGLRLAGKAGSFLYEAEYATQETHDGGTYEQDYTHLVVGAKFSGITVKVGQEVLGSDDGMKGFSTVLATKHKFNGWADKFLGTPNDGLEDTYFSIGGKLAGIKLMAVYHEFEGDETGFDYGDELDLVAVKKLKNGLKLVLKGAFYDQGDSTKGDTDKVWLMAQYAF
ncbi:MAG: alginate export family protein [Cellvibrionaceae bacterium]